MMIIRRWLAKTIKPTEEKTIENVLKSALKYYLIGEYVGLCDSVFDSLHYYRYYPIKCLSDITNYIPEFTQENAILLFNGRNRNNGYWWPVGKWWPRYRFMKWLIKHYTGK